MPNLRPDSLTNNTPSEVTSLRFGAGVGIPKKDGCLYFKSEDTTEDKEYNRKIKALKKIADRYKMLDGMFCEKCGLPANHKDKEHYLCYRHKVWTEAKTNRGRFSGKSRSVNRFNDYQ